MLAATWKKVWKVKRQRVNYKLRHLATVLLVILLSAFTVQYQDISALTLQAFYEVDFKRFTKKNQHKIHLFF
jgi:hypothetical protein